MRVDGDDGRTLKGGKKKTRTNGISLHLTKDQRTKIRAVAGSWSDDGDVDTFDGFAVPTFNAVMESSRDETPRAAAATGPGHVQVQQQQQQHYGGVRNVNPNIQHYSHPAASVIVQNAAVLGGGAAMVTMNSPPGKLRTKVVTTTLKLFDMPPKWMKRSSHR